MMKFIYSILLSIPFTLTGQNVHTSFLKKIKVSGSLNSYYKSNLSAPNNTNQISTTTAFANKSGFAIGMANIVASYSSGKIGFITDLVFGTRGEQASNTVLNQFLIHWNLSKKVKLSFGKFNTFVGYELISPVDNFNYSSSYLFSNGPFSHTGLKADFTLHEKASLMLAVMNQTDITEFNPDGSYAVGLQLRYTNQYLNVLYDKAGLGLELDYTGGFNLSNKFYLGINTAYADNKGNGFTGVAFYPQLKTSEKLTFGLRSEYFNTHSNTTTNKHTIYAATLTANYTIKNLSIKPELRIDSNRNKPFIDTKLMPTNNLSSFLIGTVYNF